MNNINTVHFGKNTVNRFDVILVSQELLNMMRHFSNPSVCLEKVKNENAPKELFTSLDIKELERNLQKLKPTPGYHVRVVHRSGSCQECANKKVFCPHLGQSIRTNVNVYEYNLK